MKKTGKKIDMVRAAFCRQFTETMRANSIDIGKYYRKVNLPSTESSQPESLLPEKPFWRLINQVALEESFPDFGAQVALAYPWHRVESLAPSIGHCKTLGELIFTFCKIAPSQSSHVQFELESLNGCYWFAAKGAPLIRNDVQMELYRVTCMIQLIQLATGSRWRPENVKLFIPKMNLIKSCPLIDKSTIIFSCRQTAIEIPGIALKLPVSLIIPYSRVNLNKYDINANFIDSLRLILEIYIAHDEYKIDAIANAIDIPRRTLQRRLEAHGTSFNELLGETRYKLAKSKLESKTWSIREISTELGYSDDAHFTRAFVRWSGITPGEFRNNSRR